MHRFVYNFLSTTVLSLFCSYGGWDVFAQTSARDLLDNYPQSSALEWIILSHSGTKSNLQKNRLLFATYFLGSPKIAINLIIDKRGAVKSVRSVYDWAEQGSRKIQLSKNQLKEMKKLVNELPVNSTRPQLENALIVSSVNGHKWSTRLYDKTNLPEQVRKIYTITSVELKLTE